VSPIVSRGGPNSRGRVQPAPQMPHEFSTLGLVNSGKDQLAPQFDHVSKVSSSQNNCNYH
jgi:hypothetical protein